MLSLRQTSRDAYRLEVTTLDDDDNSWRLSVQHHPDCIGNLNCPSATIGNGLGIDDFDGIPNTGDEIKIGMLKTSYQHSVTGGGTTCQDFHFYVDGLTSPIQLNNFDMDLVGSVTYFATSTSINYPNPITGTRSGDSSWNNGTSTTRGGDLFTIEAEDIGWWSARVCIDNNNQYIFESAGMAVFYEPIDEPSMTITKDDGITQVSSTGQTVTYTINYINNGPGAATEVIITDTFPTGATFVGCTGGCTNTATTATWDIGTMANGASGSVSLTLALSAQTPRQ